MSVIVFTVTIVKLHKRTALNLIYMFVLPVAKHVYQEMYYI
jgi:hypothetical protein